MGYIIGHEISHAYDNIDALLSKSRSSHKNWNTNTEKEFLNRSQCIVQQYSNYTLKHSNVAVSKHKYFLNTFVTLQNFNIKVL